MPRRTLPPPERVAWSDIGPELIRRWGHPNGRFMPEHLEILGPNGSGKSYAQGKLIQLRHERYGSHSVYIATKPADDTLADFGWPIIDKWPPNYDQPNTIFWVPAPPGSDDLSKQREAIHDLLKELWVPKSNIVVGVDEVLYLADDLNLRTIVNRYYREARALGITMSSGAQRPQGAPRHMHSESTWTLAFRPVDEDDCERVAQCLGDRFGYREHLMDLDRNKYEFIVKYAGAPEAYITHIE
jgi:hypothetical protein